MIGWARFASVALLCVTCSSSAPMPRETLHSRRMMQRCTFFTVVTAAHSVNSSDWRGSVGHRSRRQDWKAHRRGSTSRVTVRSVNGQRVAEVGIPPKASQTQPQEKHRDGRSRSYCNTNCASSPGQPAARDRARPEHQVQRQNLVLSMLSRQRALCAPRHLYRMRQSHLGRVTVRSANMTLIPRCSDGTRLFNSHGVADRANDNGHLRSVEQPCWLVHLRRKRASARGLGNLLENQASHPGGNHIGVTSVVPTAMVCVPVHRSHQTQRRSGYRDDSIQGCEAQPFARNILGPHSGRIP